MSRSAPVASPVPAPPVLDRPLIAALREDLEAAQYTSERAHELLGPVAAAALGREQALPARRVLGPMSEPAAVLLDLFTLGAVRPRGQVESALPRLGVDGAIRLGILAPVPEDASLSTPGAAAPSRPAPESKTPSSPSSVRSLVDLAPYSAEDDAGAIRWWIASDLSELATGCPIGPDHVLGVGGASLTLVRITPRGPVARALDMGCGCGIQALHAARHARSVVATDLSPRALAFTAFNAALNGVELDLREGSLFDPVVSADGTPERFDLVVSNPPFVITPRGGAVREWTYRDGGAAGDLLLGQIVRTLPRHLEPGGRAVMLGNWEITATEPAGATSGAETTGDSGDTGGTEPESPTDLLSWDAHPRAWCDGTGLDALIVQREQEDPAQYAETWARDGGVTERDADWEPMITAWLEDFASRRTAAIGFGYLLLARPLAPGEPIVVTEDITSTGNGALGAHLSASLDAQRTLAALDDAALLRHRPVRAPDVIERRHLTPGAWDPLLIELVQGAGLGRTIRASSLLAATVGAADGELTLAQILGAVCALTGEDESVAHAEILPAVRELVRTGMLELPDTTGPDSAEHPDEVIA